MPSRMKSAYSANPKGGNQPRSNFDYSRRKLTTFDGSDLVPIDWFWVFPGDIVRTNFQGFCRMSSPLDFPLFDNLSLTIHSFFTPLRQTWTNARKFLGEQHDPGDSISYTLPEYGTNSALDTQVGTQQTKLLKHLDVPPCDAAGGGLDEADLCAIPVRAYLHIYNHHYRDQNQINSVDWNDGDGPDDAYHAQYLMQKRGKRHDRYTSLLEAPQKGDAVPIHSDVRADLGTSGIPTIYSDNLSAYRILDSDAAAVDLGSSTGSGATNVLHTELLINDLRNAAAIQQFLERDNRYGTRYDEIIYSHFGVEYNEPAIIPTYLGGGSGYITTSAIPNQSGSSGNLGDLAAIATGTVSGAGYTYAVQEPGIIMSIASVVGDISYAQGLEKKWSYRTRYDLFWPEFVNIGDQACLTQEVFYDNASTDDDVLGYEPRYEELRTRTNIVGGEFAHNDDLPLNNMHLSEEFASAPVLGQTWVEDATPIDRVLQVTTQDQFLADFFCNTKIARQLPVMGIPGMKRI
jgi:hypothetical protein